MKKKNNHLDEMQEQKLLEIESKGFWFAFWALLAAIMIQTFAYDESPRAMAGEWIVFMCLSIYMLIGCLKNGIWDRKLKANGKTNVIVSFISSLLCALAFAISSYIKYGAILGSIATGVFIFISVFILTLSALSVTLKLYKKKVSKMEVDCDE